MILSNLPGAVFEGWRKRLGFLVWAAFGSGAFLGYRFAEAWSFALFPTLVMGVVIVVPVIGIFFLWWLLTELSNIPNLVNEISSAAGSLVIPLERSRSSDNVYASPRPDFPENKVGISKRALKAVFRCMGIYWDVSDASSAIGLTLTLLNPISLTFFGVS